MATGGGNVNIVISSDDDDDDDDEPTTSSSKSGTGGSGGSKKAQVPEVSDFAYHGERAETLTKLFARELDAMESDGKFRISKQQQPWKVILKCDKGGQTLLATKKEELDKMIDSLKTDQISTTMKGDQSVIEAYFKKKDVNDVMYMYNFSAGMHNFVLYSQFDDRLKTVKDELEEALDKEYNKSKTEGQVKSSRQNRKFNISDCRHYDNGAYLIEDGDERDDVYTQTASSDNTRHSSSSSSSGGFEHVGPADCGDTGYQEKASKINFGGKGSVIFEFTIQKFRVQLYKGSITDVGCDAIVNAANEHLDNGAGVAQAISRAAGRDFKRECRQKIDDDGIIRVTENVVTKAGNLPCGYVIHTVGPRWYQYRDKEKCFDHLRLAVDNILETAEQMKFQSVVMPPVSSGIFGVPKEGCAAMYIKALTDFAEGNRRKHLKRFVIIDIDDKNLDMVKEAYEKWNKDPLCVEPSNVAKQHSTSQGSHHRGDNWQRNAAGQWRKQTNQSSRQREISCEEKWENVYKIGGELNVHIYSGDIISLNQSFDVLVTSENRAASGEGYLSKKIMERGGKKYRDLKKEKFNRNKKKNLEIGNVLATGAGDMRCKLVFHAIIERFPQKGHPSNEHLSQLYQTTLNILQKVVEGKKKRSLSAKYKGIKSIAMPLLGISLIEDTDHLKQYCECIYSAICEYVASEHVTLTDVYIVDYNANKTDLLLSVFRSHAQATTQNKTSFDGNDGHSNKKNREQHSGHSNSQVPPSNTPKSHTGGGQYNKAGFDRNDAHSNKELGHHQESPSAIPKSHAGRGQYNSNKTFQPEKYRKMDLWKLQKATDADINQYLEKRESKKSQGNLMIIDDEEEDTTEGATAPEAQAETSNCTICISEMDDPVKLKQCGHQFCRECISEFFTRKPVCPVCNMTYGIVYGDQPENGTATVYEDRESLPGFYGCLTAIIDYEFPDGKQSEDHPNPGQKFEGLRRQAYVPLNGDGREVLGLLKRAFEQGVIFTVGTSRTSGKENVLTWNDIHHKTRRQGGPEKFGYPDDEYLTRVKEELKAKGIE